MALFSSYQLCRQADVIALLLRVGSSHCDVVSVIDNKSDGVTACLNGNRIWEISRTYRCSAVRDNILLSGLLHTFLLGLFMQFV